MTGDLRRIPVVLSEGFELLDVSGPAELFSLVPDRLAIEFTGPGAGPVAGSQGGQVTRGHRLRRGCNPRHHAHPRRSGHETTRHRRGLPVLAARLGDARVSGDLGVHGVRGPGGGRLARRLPGDLEQGRL